MGLKRSPPRYARHSAQALIYTSKTFALRTQKIASPKILHMLVVSMVKKSRSRHLFLQDPLHTESENL